MNIIELRREYSEHPLHKEDLDTNPFKQFERWFNDAIDARIIEANAMSLATVDASARPSIRTVLLKLFDEKGFDEQFEKTQKPKGRTKGLGTNIKPTDRKKRRHRHPCWHRRQHKRARAA